ncbi:hypothetical protein C8Q75DRAFT_710676 [Abortiporus biennis]|nr:hypothetical protein C8Q75DRAFT_710676 [Abortiporus biennis]
MSFSFKWPRFSDQFHADAIQMLDAALNKGNKPPVIADKIEVVELEMGTQPPELEIRDIGELTMDQFRGIFRLTYNGDAHIVLRTKVQANPLNHKQPDIHLMGGSSGMLAAKHPLVVPMLLRLSHFRLNSYVVLVVSKQKGITLVFKTDPLQNVDINSTFDSIAVIQKFIQKEIEGQLRQMFREDLPGIIHRLSQQWVKAKVEAPYLNKRPPPTSRLQSMETASAPDLTLRMPPRIPSAGFQPPLMRSQTASLAGYPRPRSSSALSVSSVGGRKATTSISSPTSPEPNEGPTSFPHLEQFDPTYGLRPERLPTKSVFNSFRSLFTPNRGLADLTEEPSEIDDEEGNSFDVANWEELLSESQFSGAPPSTTGIDDSQTEYETVPAVGGGTITRPRVIHSQSQVQIDLGDGLRSPVASPVRPPGSSRLSQAYASLSPRSSISQQLYLSMSEQASNTYNPYFAGTTPMYDPSDLEFDDDIDGSSYRSLSHIPQPSFSRIPPVPPLEPALPRPGSPSSTRTHPSRSSDVTHSVPTPPPQEGEDDPGIRINRPRRPSFSSLHNMDRFYTGSPPEHYSMHLEHDPKIVLKPTVSSVTRLSTLSHSNHTLSPYTRTPEHFTVRSVPPRESTSSGSASAVDRLPVKAKRKRIHRLGGKPKTPPVVEEERPPVDNPSAPHSPAPLSDFDASDMDRYFRSRDDLVAHYPDFHPSHVRRRFPQPS